MTTPLSGHKQLCKAKSRTGKPCRNLALAGTTVCRFHGGMAPQVQRAALRNLAFQQAHRMVLAAGVDQDPIQHLLDCLYRSAALVNVWGIMVAALDADAADRIGDGLRGELGYRVAPASSRDDLRVTSTERLLGLNSKGEATIHPFVVEYNQALERRARFAKLCLDAGVSERQIQLAERLGEQLSAIFERTMAAIKGLTEPQRSQAAKAYAREIQLLERPAIDGTATEAA